MRLQHVCIVQDNKNNKDARVIYKRFIFKLLLFVVHIVAHSTLTSALAFCMLMMFVYCNSEGYSIGKSTFFITLLMKLPTQEVKRGIPVTCNWMNMHTMHTFPRNSTKALEKLTGFLACKIQVFPCNRPNCSSLKSNSPLHEKELNCCHDNHYSCFCKSFI